MIGMVPTCKGFAQPFLAFQQYFFIFRMALFGNECMKQHTFILHVFKRAASTLVQSYYSAIFQHVEHFIAMLFGVSYYTFYQYKVFLIKLLIRKLVIDYRT